MKFVTGCSLPPVISTSPRIRSSSPSPVTSASIALARSDSGSWIGVWIETNPALGP
jgi:hypothetical protein